MNLKRRQRLAVRKFGLDRGCGVVLLRYLFYFYWIGFGFANVDPTLEDRPIFNLDPHRAHISGYAAVGANLQSIGSNNVANDRSEDHHFPSGDAGLLRCRNHRPA